MYVSSSVFANRWKATKDAAIRKIIADEEVSLNDPLLDEKILQQEHEAQNPGSKPHPASLNSHRISFEDHRAGREPPISANVEKSGFQESSHAEQQTDNRLNKIPREQVEMGSRTSQLVPIHEDAASTTDDPAVSNTPSLIPSIENGLKTHNTEATPAPDSQPLKEFSPFANLFMLKPPKAETDIEGEQKGSENGASGSLIGFLIKSGLF